MSFIFLLNLVLSLFAVGLIWTIQLVHYPSMKYIPEDRFTEYHNFHSIRISILEKDIAKAAEIPGFATQILNINISGEEQNVILKELQRHPATQRVLHADLQRVNPDTKISISVPVRFLNEDICMGVKMHGGAISRLINNIDITCLASNLPEYLEVDVAELDVGDSVFLSALNLPQPLQVHL